MKNNEFYRFIKINGIVDYDNETKSIILSNKKAYSLDDSFLKNYEVIDNKIHKITMLSSTK
jgi:hypothetical protein